jgi:hypothetical protein
MSKSYYDKTLDSKVSYREPLFLIKLDLVPNKSNVIDGGGDSLYHSIKKNISLRRNFIKALHLATDNSWRILRNSFFEKKTPLMDNSHMSYTYLDDKADKFVDNCPVLDFPLINSTNITTKAKSVYDKSGKCTIIKTHSVTDHNSELINYWYSCMGLTSNFDDELQTWKNAGFNIKDQFQPKESNPLSIQYIKLIKL